MTEKKDSPHEINLDEYYFPKNEPEFPFIHKISPDARIGSYIPTILEDPDWLHEIVEPKSAKNLGEVVIFPRRVPEISIVKPTTGFEAQLATLLKFFAEHPNFAFTAVDPIDR